MASFYAGVTEEDFLCEIQKMKFEPGDCLVIRYSCCLSDEQMTNIRKAVKSCKFIPDGVDVLVFDCYCEDVTLNRSLKAE